MWKGGGQVRDRGRLTSGTAVTRVERRRAPRCFPARQKPKDTGERRCALKRRLEGVAVTTDGRAGKTEVASHERHRRPCNERADPNIDGRIRSLKRAEACTSRVVTVETRETKGRGRGGGDPHLRLKSCELGLVTGD